MRCYVKIWSSYLIGSLKICRPFHRTGIRRGRWRRPSYEQWKHPSKTRRRLVTEIFCCKYMMPSRTKITVGAPGAASDESSLEESCRFLLLWISFWDLKGKRMRILIEICWQDPLLSSSEEFDANTEFKLWWIHNCFSAAFFPSRLITFMVVRIQ